MRFELLDTENYIQFTEAIARLDRLPKNMDRMGLGQGNYGIGKSNSIDRVLEKYDNGKYLRCLETWTVGSVVTKLCELYTVDTVGKTSAKFEALTDEIKKSKENYILIIDEVDKILKSNKSNILELFRDLHDEARVIIFFIGMNQAEAKFKKHGHYHSRLTETITFKSTSKKDVKNFCELSEVLIEDDLVDYFFTQYGNLRDIKLLIVRLEEYAELQDLTSVNLKTLKDYQEEKKDEKK